MEIKQRRMEWSPRKPHFQVSLDPMVSICADREQNCSVGSMTAENRAWKGPRKEAAWSPGLRGELFRPRGSGQGKVKKELVKRWKKWKSMEAKAGEKLRPTCEGAGRMGRKEARVTEQRNI